MLRASGPHILVKILSLSVLQFPHLYNGNLTGFHEDSAGGNTPSRPGGRSAWSTSTNVSQTLVWIGESQTGEPLVVHLFLNWPACKLQTLQGVDIRIIPGMVGASAPPSQEPGLTDCPSPLPLQTLEDLIFTLTVSPEACPLVRC